MSLHTIKKLNLTNIRPQNQYPKEYKTMSHEVGQIHTGSDFYGSVVSIDAITDGAVVVSSYERGCE